jgi:hypothetical protein
VVETLPHPTLVKGRPTNWDNPITKRGHTGRLRVVVGDKDVTYFRDVPTRISGYQLTDPYGHGPATLEFPQITTFDIDTLNWLQIGALVNIDLITPGEGMRHLWFGFVIAINSNDGFVSVECAGELSGRMSLRDRQQPVIHRRRDIGELIQTAWRGTNKSFRVEPNEFLVGGGDIDNFYGSNQTDLAFCDSLLNLARGPDGDWTIMPKPNRHGRVYEPRIRDTDTVHATIYLGARGVRESLTNDVTEHPNRIYGQGIAPDGESWHNHMYPNLWDENAPDYPGFLQQGDEGEEILVLTYELAASPYLNRDHIGTHYTAAVARAIRALQREAGLPTTGDINQQTWNAIWGDGAEQQSFAQATTAPLAADTKVMALLHSRNWSVIGTNPHYDDSTVRVDRSIDYGDNVWKDRARQHAQRLVDRGQDGHWVGSITLQTDLAAGDHHHGDLQAGMNIRLRNFAGDIKLHIGAISVDVSGETPTISMTVDQQGRDALTIAEIIERNQLSKNNPARRHHPRPGSFPTTAISGWDGESGAGLLKRTELTYGWNMLWTPGAQEGVIKAVEYHNTNPGTWLALAIFCRPVDKEDLEQRIPNPFELRDDDFSWWNAPGNSNFFLGGDNPRLIYAAGGPTQPGGYSPRQWANSSGQPTGAEWTGTYLEVGDFPFHAHPLLYVAVYVDDDCTGHGQLWTQIVEGV